MTQLLTAMATPVWAYLALFGFLTVDAMIPVVPVQAIMITTGALTVYGNLDLTLVIITGALGMLAGDSIAFLLGRSTGNVGRHWLGGLRARFAPAGGSPTRGRERPGTDETPGRGETPGHGETPGGSERAIDGPGDGGERAGDPPRTSGARRAATRFTRGLRRPGPLVLLLCRFVPGGRMAAGFHAGRTGYPLRLFALYDGAAAVGWATYGGLVGHVGGTAVTQSAWRLFAIAAGAAVVFGTAGWILALFGGREPAVEAGGETAGPPPGETNGPTHRQPNEPTHRQPNGSTHRQANEPTHRQPNGPTHRQPNEPTHRQGNGRARGKASGPAGSDRHGPAHGEAAGAALTAARAASADGPLPRSSPTATGRS